MKINKNNLFARYYQWIYGNLPNDVCSFFWGSVLAIGLFPILVVGRLFNDSYYPEFGKTLGAGILFYFLYTMATFLGLMMYGGLYLDLPEGEKFNLSDHYHLLELTWYGLLFGMPLVLVGAMLGMVVILGVPIGIIWLILKGLGKTVSVAKHTVFVENTKDFVGAIRRKHCTKINWN